MCFLSSVTGPDGRGRIVAGVDVEEDDTGINISVDLMPERSRRLHIGEIKSDLLARFTLSPDAQVRVSSISFLPRCSPLVHDVPGFGWKAWLPAHSRTRWSSSARPTARSYWPTRWCALRCRRWRTLRSMGWLASIVWSTRATLGHLQLFASQHDLVVDTPEQVVLGSLERAPYAPWSCVERRPTDGPNESMRTAANKGRRTQVMVRR